MIALFTRSSSVGRGGIRCVRALVAAVIFGMLGLVWSGNVSEKPEADDLLALTRSDIVKLEEVGAANRWSADAQRAALKSLVARVHGRITGLDALPARRTREPADVLGAASGVCFDRARVIEKAARTMGFTVRRVFLVYGDLIDLVRSGGPSHTLVEVEWQGRWVFLGTLTPITGFAPDGRVWSVADLQKDATTGARFIQSMDWKEVLPQRFVPVVGLYSRHGQHYPPYTPFPDYSARQVFTAVLP